MPTKSSVGKGGIDEVLEECGEEKELLPSPLEEGLWRLCWRGEGQSRQPLCSDQRWTMQAAGHGGPGRAKELDRVLKHEIHVHTGRAKQEQNEEVICCFWKLKVMQDLYRYGGKPGFWPGPSASLTPHPGLSGLEVWAAWRKWGRDAAGMGARPGGQFVR